MNELSKESSPYLLQHAENPVHWKAWNDTSLKLARDSDRMIIMSSGYSACHWCHVMEHECFENEEAAAIMNEHFVNIKVDREERPDIDAVYMKALQIMTGRGGWPMNIICLPDGRPVWGASYVPKKEWMSYLLQLSEMYRNEPEKILDYAERLHRGLESISLVPPPDDAAELSQELYAPLLKKWAKGFDKEYGGYARAPKFMMPVDYRFLLRYGHQYDKPKLIEHVNRTLTRMAWGGLFDTIDGGFSRYSVDMRWHVPHFEKMLYDNGQLISLYSEAFKLTREPLYQEVIEKTLRFIDRELTNDECGFFSALDADSINKAGKLEEGAFYSWSKEELQSLLADDLATFSELFNINEFGYWEHGNYVLIQNKPLDDVARECNISPDLLRSKKQLWEEMLYAEREKREKPRLDDKCLTSWNAIMLKGYIDAYKALGTVQYLNTALRNADFITQKLWSQEGNLWRNYKNGTAAINGYLEDYAHVIEAFIDLYTVTFDEKWLLDAKRLCDYCFDYFYDEASGFFRFTSRLDAELIATHFELEDNVIPASNSVMAKNLFRLSVYFGNSHYEQVCHRMLKFIIPGVDYPSAFANWLDVYLNFAPENRELAITGNGARSFAEKLNAGYHPNLVIAAADAQSSLEFLNGRFANDKTLFYVCQNKTCALPVETFEAALTELSIK